MHVPAGEPEGYMVVLEPLDVIAPSTRPMTAIANHKAPVGLFAKVDHPGQGLVSGEGIWGWMLGDIDHSMLPRPYTT